MGATPYWSGYDTRHGRNRFHRSRTAGEHAHVSKDLRGAIVFAHHNVLRDAPFTRLDLVSCRNLLIYFKPGPQRKVLTTFHFALKASGVLFLGPSEAPGALADEFSVVDPRWKIFRKKRDVRLSPGDVPVTPARPDEGRGMLHASPEDEPRVCSAREALVQRFAPPTLVVDNAFNLLHAFNGAGRYQSQRDGRPSLNVLDLLGGELKFVVGAALRRVSKEREHVTYTGVSLGRGPAAERVTVTVGCVETARGEDTFLVSFERARERAEPQPPEPSVVHADLGELARERIAALEGELRQTRENLQATVEEMETSNEELQATNEELVASNERKRAAEESRLAVQRRDHLLAMLSHELRTPLGAILNAAELLARSDPRDAQRRPLEIVRRQSWHMARLLDDLLDVARLTRNQMKLERRAVDLGAVLRDVVAAAQPSADKKGLRLRLDLPEAAVTVLGDPVRLQQVVANLVSNAVRYTSQGSVALALAEEAGEAVVRVRDTGVGMTGEALARAFELFYQAPQALDRASGGLGVGLSLAQRLAELHGGRISAASDGPGRGSEFTVHLPLARSRAESAGRDGVERRPRHLRVAIIEDSDDIRETMREILELEGHRVIEAANGLDGAALVIAERPHVAFVDVGLPRMDGYAVARQVREALGPTVRLVALTGYGRPEDRAAAASAGFDIYAVKPLESDRLLRMLEEEPAPPPLARHASRARRRSRTPAREAPPPCPSRGRDEGYVPAHCWERLTAPSRERAGRSSRPERC